MKNEQVEIFGIDEVKRLLDEQVPKQANNIMRATIHSIAAELTKSAKARVPIGKTKRLKKAIKTKRRKSPPEKPVSDVIITSGASAKADGFYWRFVEYGTGGGKGSHIAKQYQSNAQPFLLPARKDVESRLGSIIEQQFTKKIRAATKRIQKRNAKK